MLKPATLPVLLLSLLLAACARPAPDRGITVEGLGSAGETASTIGLSDIEIEAESSALSYTTDDPLSQRIIYFAYDSNQLSPESRVVAEAHAQYMLNNPSAQIILEGHADERGTREYNLALGESRARSISDIMRAYGLRIERIQLISYGEEQPVALGSSESAWRQNRRVELIYQ